MTYTFLSLSPSTPIYHKPHTFYWNTGTWYKVTKPYHNPSPADHFSLTQNTKTSRTRWYTAGSPHIKTILISTPQQPGPTYQLWTRNSPHHLIPNPTNPTKPNNPLIYHNNTPCRWHPRIKQLHTPNGPVARSPKDRNYKYPPTTLPSNTTRKQLQHPRTEFNYNNQPDTSNHRKETRLPHSA